MTLRMIHKLHSERGASMSMALMLFLVCTVVSSVAISAATATIGREAELEEYDTSYYNLTSAAGLFWDVLQDGVEVTVRRTCLDLSDPEDATWTASIDNTSAKSSFSPLDSSYTGTLFEMATIDLLFDTTGTPDALDAARTISSLAVSNSMNTNGIQPTPKDIEFPKVVEYEPFDVSLTDGSLPAVQVTLTRISAYEYELIFENPEDEGTDVKALFAIYMDVSVNTTVDYIAGTWDTTVRWSPYRMVTGG